MAIMPVVLFHDDLNTTISLFIFFLFFVVVYS